MVTNIHPSAVVEEGAQLGTDVSVGPFAYVGAQVSIGDHSVVDHHATVDGNTTVGESNEIFPYAYVGAKTHDLKFTGGSPGLKIGDRNVFRALVSPLLAPYFFTFFRHRERKKDGWQNQVGGAGS